MSFSAPVIPTYWEEDRNDLGAIEPLGSVLDGNLIAFQRRNIAGS
jgi:hypothetical protein